MRRSALAAALLMLSPGLRPARGWDGPPLLAPPALEPPAEAPPTAPSPKDKEEPPRPLLVIPGVTAPSGSPRTASKPPSSPAPSLDGPRLSRIPTDAEELPPPGVSLSPALEPIPPDDEDQRPPQEAKPVPVREAKPVPSRESEPPAPSSPSPPAASRRFLGGLLGASEGNSNASGDGITIEPHSDPAVEAAVKRRVEKQIEEELGDRLQNVKVFVKGREILIKARASRFWFRRSARKSLDALPLPSGYRARVEVD